MLLANENVWGIDRDVPLFHATGCLPILHFLTVFWFGEGFLSEGIHSVDRPLKPGRLHKSETFLCHSPRASLSRLLLRSSETETQYHLLISDPMDA